MAHPRVPKPAKVRQVGDTIVGHFKSHKIHFLDRKRKKPFSRDI